MENTSLLTNSVTHNFYNELQENLLCCTEFKMSVAFISYGGIQVLLETLQELCDRGVKGQILTTSYQNFTQPQVLERLSQFSNIELKIYVPPTEQDGFHAKGYLFRQPIQNQKEKWTVIIGSSNITGRALKSNVEWNLLESEVSGKNLEPGVFSKSVLDEFNILWKSPYAKDYSDSFILEYRDYLTRVKEQQKKVKIESFSFGQPKVIQPNLMQQEAIVKLDKLRKTGAKKALAIAATGSGKTYMSVFDALQVNPKRLLFIVHREDILHKAKESFDAICSDKEYSSGFFTGNEKASDCKYLFATRDSLSRHYTEFDKKAFDYIVLDEAHHATSESYKNILNYFQTEFLLGLTATPERSDSGDIYSVFDNNIAVEIRLRDALTYDIIAPFHYFGLTDVEGLDYSSIQLSPDDSNYLEQVSKLLIISRRVDYIIEKMIFYGHDGEKTKALGFCATVEHARYMADEFNKRLSINGNSVAVALCGEDSVPVREMYTKRLEDDDDVLQYIFTVDIFNEGIDIPSTNLVLMLRPTDSSIIFIQQLGRGLRKLPGKEFVTVLDFIGNYNKSFLMAIALFGKKDFDKDALKVAVHSDFADLPNGTYIHMDRIAKEQILNQLENERFMSMKYMKEMYLAFKVVNGGKIPFLCDYLKHDGAVDPLKFTVFNAQLKTYIEFVTTVEKETHPELTILLQNESFKTFMRYIFTFLPARRIEEIVAIKKLIEKGNCTLEEVKIELTHHVDYENEKSFLHAMQTLTGAFFDSNEHTRFDSILPVLNDDRLELSTQVKSSVFEKTQARLWLLDAINYSLLRYDFDFGRADYSMDEDGNETPFLKLNNEYTMKSIAPLCLYIKIHSSFRGQGLITAAKPNYFLFVNLHKDANVKESINYKDKFLTRSTFQWESPNSTSQSSDVGQNLIHNIERNISLHLFVRKFEEVEGITQPFIYLGKVMTLPESAEGDKPIKMVFALEHEVSEEIYIELTTVVE